jgi:large subunit ribosomal protein L25
MHPFKMQVQHIDFQRVSKDKKIHMKVPLHFVNAEKSPGVKEQAGVVNHVMNELDIVCFPDDLPEFIEVDLGNLSVGHSLHIRDVSMPKGVELAMHKDENPVVATVVVPALVAEEEEAAPAVSAAEVPTTEQAAPAKEGEGEAGAAAGKGGDKGAAAPKAAEKPAAEKKEKK